MAARGLDLITAAHDRRLRWVVAVVLACALPWLAGCETLIHPQSLHVNVVGIEPLDSKGMELRFAVKLRIQNPNDIGIDYDGVAFDLALDGQTLASGVSDAKGSVPRFGEAEIVIPVSISALAALRQALAFTNDNQRGEIPYTVSGKLGGGPFGSVHFTRSGTLRLAH